MKYEINKLIKSLKQSKKTGYTHIDIWETRGGSIRFVPYCENGFVDINYAETIRIKVKPYKCVLSGILSK